MGARPAVNTQLNLETANGNRTVVETQSETLATRRTSALRDPWSGLCRAVVGALLREDIEIVGFSCRARHTCFPSVGQGI